MPALILDRAFEERLRRSPRRAAFFCAAVDSLAAQLRERGTRLIVRSGPRRAVVRKLAREARAERVVWSAAYDATGMEADRALQAAVEEAGLRAVIVHDAPAVPPEETTAARSSAGAGYLALAPYLIAWASASRAVVETRPTFGAASFESEDLPAPTRFGSDHTFGSTAGESGARAVLERFLRGPALSYATARSVPAVPTSGLAAHLSFGTIGARTVLHAVDQRIADPFLLAEERFALETFSRALARRDFFYQLGWFYEGTPDRPLQARMRGFRFARTHPAFDAWRSGTTGYPLVDAGMRELLATGAMHPRARQVAASFLCFDLGVDWRAGRDAWDHLLIEDDPALATGNWQWVAGVGADLAQFPRIFNPNRQARRLDPQGEYVKRWIPELAALPAAEILEPQARARRAQLALPLFGGDGYPQPVVAHDDAARAFLQRYLEYARRPGARS